MPYLYAGEELQKQGANLQLPNGAFFALMCLDPLQAATAGLLPYCTTPLFAILLQPQVITDHHVSSIRQAAVAFTYSPFNAYTNTMLSSICIITLEHGLHVTSCIPVLVFLRMNTNLHRDLVQVIQYRVPLD